jgi:hypothetical protein
MSHAGAPTRREFVAEAASAVLVTTRVPHVAPVPLRDYRQVRVGLLRVASFTTLGALTPTAATGEAMALAVESLHRAGCAVASFEVPMPTVSPR